MEARLTWVDAARTLAMLLVVAVHVNLFTQTDFRGWWPGGYWSVIGYSLAVPTFFLLSGLVLGRSHAGRPLDRVAFARRRLVTLLVPFFAWNVLMVVLESLLDQPVAPLTAAYYALTGYWHLYFVFALAQLLTLFAWVAPRLSGRALTWTALAGLALTVLFYALSDVLLRLQGPDEEFFERNFNRLFLPWAGFFFIGVWLGARPGAIDRLRRLLVPVALLAAAAFVPYYLELVWQDETYWSTSRRQLLLGGLPYQLFGSLAFAGALASLERFAAGRAALRPLATAGADTFGIYLCHNAALMLFVALLQRFELEESAWSSVPALAGLTLTASWSFVRLVRLPGLRWLGSMLFASRARAMRPLARRDGTH